MRAKKSKKIHLMQVAASAALLSPQAPRISAGNAKVKNLEVADSSANIGAKFASLLNQPNKISKITES